MDGSGRPWALIGGASVLGRPAAQGHTERASGRGRYVGGGWLRTPLSEFEAICVREPWEVAGN